MKKNAIRFISSILSVIMLLSICAYATDDKNICEDAIIADNATFEDNIYYEIYSSLSPEAKLLFNEMIKDSTRLTYIHNRYVANSFANYISQESSHNAESKVNSTSVSDILRNLQTALESLRLPDDVLYSLEAVGSSMVAAIADGALPVGDILAAFAVAQAVVVIADNWDEIGNQWVNVVKAFKQSFSNVNTDVDSAFAEVKSNVSDVQNRARISHSISATRKVVNINNTTYKCSVSASEITKKDAENKRYFVAVKYKDDVYVDLSSPIEYTLAKQIVAANDSTVGVFATSETFAKPLGGFMPIIESHGTSYNYYIHMHNRLYRHAHIWYPNIPL